MKMKKFLASLLAAAMVLGCVPQSAWGVNLGQVQAEEDSTSTNDFSQYGAYLTGLTDQDGRACTFIAKSGSQTDGTSTKIKRNSDVISENDSEKGKPLFDSIYSYTNLGDFIHLENGAGNTQDQDDYVGLIFNEAITMNSVCFTLGDGTDRYKSSKLQYLAADTNEWTDVEDATFGTVSTCKKIFAGDSAIENVKGIRLVCTDTTKQAGWLRVYEIEVNQFNKFRYGFTSSHNYVGVYPTAGRVEVFLQGKNYESGTETGFESSGTQQNLTPCLDGDDTTSAILWGNAGAGNFTNDQISPGDYIALIYDEAVPINTIRFLMDSRTSPDDYMQKSKLQYTVDGVQWVDLQEFTSSEVKMNQEELAAFNLPEQVKGIRLFCTQDSGVKKWLRISEISAYYDDGYVVKAAMTATAGTAHAESHAKDKGVSGALDNDSNTWWHSNYDSDNGQIQKFWYDVKFNQPTWIDGIEQLPRQKGSNGVITEYEVWVSNVDNPTDLSNITDQAEYTKTWQSEYIKVCDGTWADNGDGSTVWKTASFEPVKAKHVRLVATATKNGSNSNDQFVTMVEFRVKKAESQTSFFQGGALRMDAADGEANLRLQYAFPETLNGMNLKTDEWSWNYGTGLDENGKIASVTNQPVTSNKYKVVDGTYYSNLVFTHIKEKNYGKSVYAQLVIPYANENNTETLKVYTSVDERSVAGIATQIVDAYTGQEDKEDQVTYAQTILQNQSMVQLGDDNTFSGEKVSVTKCEYTFTAVEGSENTFTVSAKTAEGKTVYLNIPSNNNNTNVHSTTSANITFVDKGSSEFAPTMNNQYLWFCYAGPSYFQSSNQADAVQCKYEIYQKVSEVKADQIIKGYDRVTELSEITTGQYLIVRQAQSGNTKYLLHPTTSSIACNNTAKLLSNSSN